MAQQGFNLHRGKLCCSICLDLMIVPVTIPCGHSYCMSCIKSHWDGEDQKGIHSWPQCRQTFIPRPELIKNTMIADLVEELKEMGLQDAPADHCYAGAEDVACDFCTGRKLKALRSCLQCLVSYCEQHLQPHYDVATLKKHTLVEPSKKLQENSCSHHGEVMRIFCRTDQQCICYLCSMDEHKGHHTVSAAAEVNERQKELEPRGQKFQQRIQDREKDVKVLLQEVEAIDRAADEVVADSETIFTELIQFIEERRSAMKQQIRSQQKTEADRVRDLLQKLEEEISELKGKDAELKQLCCTEDHTQFLHMLPLLSEPGETTKLPCLKSRRLRYFGDVLAAVLELHDKVQGIIREEWPKISRILTDVDVLLPQAEPTTRAEFLQYSCQITLDPNTVSRQLMLSEGNRRATYRKKQTYPSHPERFMSRSQVLSRESLTGRRYFEVEWDGIGAFIALAYKDISRTGDESEFGIDENSWALLCSYDEYEFYHDNVKTVIPAPQFSKIGVYLDHNAGILSFYGVSDTMTLIHRVQTTFTQPLYAGFRAFYFLLTKCTALFCELN